MPDDFSSSDRRAIVQGLEAVVRAQERQGDNGAPGFAVGVVYGDDVLLRNGVGMASIEHSVPIDSRTAFRIASVSKQFTCAAVLLLAREGKLDIDADIRDVLPGRLPHLTDVAKGALSLRNLMHMSSGLRDFLTLFRATGIELEHRLDTAQIDAMVDAHRGLNFTPNTRFLYCNTNYLLLGQAVEKISGQTLRDFLQQRIFTPLGMSQTRHTPEPDSVEPGLATNYMQRPDGNGVWDPRGGRWARVGQGFPLGGEGGLVSTLDDLLLWARALREPPQGFEFLPALLRQTQDFSHGFGNVYARGQQVLPYRGLRTVEHSGLWPGFRTEFMLVPDRAIAIVVIANDSGLNPHSIARRLLDALLLPELGAPEKSAPPPRPALYFDDTQGLAVEIGGPNPMHANAPTLTLFGGTFPLRYEGEGWWEVEAAAIVLKVKPEQDGLTLIDDAGHRTTLVKIDRGRLPDGIDGVWHCAELNCTWTIAGSRLGVSSPMAGEIAGWSVKPLVGKWVEILAPGRIIPAAFTAKLEGDTLTVHTARARGLRFARV